jgi:hypothetical protein
LLCYGEWLAIAKRLYHTFALAKLRRVIPACPALGFQHIVMATQICVLNIIPFIAALLFNNIICASLVRRIVMARSALDLALASISRVVIEPFGPAKEFHNIVLAA